MNITFYQDLLIDNIACQISSEANLLPNSKLDICGRTNAGHGDIKLSMGKTGVVQPDTNILESLPLRLVDSHCKGQTYWELMPTPFKRKLSLPWSQSNPWNQDCSVAKLFSNNFAF